eukprot:tig00000215_g18560.t1
MAQHARSSLALVLVIALAGLAAVSAGGTGGGNGTGNGNSPAKDAAVLAPRVDANGTIIACPIFKAKQVSWRNCSEQLGPKRECRGAAGCFGANEPDPRRIQVSGDRNGTVNGTCSSRAANLATGRPVQCTLQCGGKKCPRGLGWAYACSNSTCVKAEKLFNLPNDTACPAAGQSRRDACGLCGGKGRDLCGRCPKKGQAANATCDFPAGALPMDALVAPGTTDENVTQALSDLTGVDPSLFAVTSRTSSSSRRMGRHMRHLPAARRSALQASRPARARCSRLCALVSNLLRRLRSQAGASGDSIVVELLLEAAASGAASDAGLLGLRSLLAVGAELPAGYDPLDAALGGAPSAAAPLAGPGPASLLGAVLALALALAAGLLA